MPCTEACSVYLRSVLIKILAGQDISLKSALLCTMLKEVADTASLQELVRLSTTADFGPFHTETVCSTTALPKEQVSAQDSPGIIFERAAEKGSCRAVPQYFGTTSGTAVVVVLTRPVLHQSGLPYI